ncbi:MAG TPA: ATP-grasp domain-containing protein [Candidatus Cloacimonadota bacterium]|nr:ATP-grasp domain-containing protein [Candidatus Cloacimonadota bacterium]
MHRLRKPWASINTDLFIDELKKRDYQVEFYEFYQAANDLVKLENEMIIYSFSQRYNLRFLIKDTVKHLEQLGNRLIPDYNLLYCHENKGYQEFYKKQLGITEPRALYFSSKREIQDLNIQFPKVLKTIEGSNGRGVYLVKSKQDVFNIMKKLEKPLSIWEKIDLLRRKYFRKQKLYPGYPEYNVKNDYFQYRDYIQEEIPFILQDFVENLNCDYRVIVLYDRYYAVKRMTKEGDFRASGTKRFVFEFDMPAGLLDYAKKIFNIFHSPLLSMDIGFNGEKYFLFEYQAIHFGINAIVRSNGYYKEVNQQWQFIQEKTVFESALAEALDKYIQNMKA